jgi:hypothetical protein
MPDLTYELFRLASQAMMAVRMVRVAHNYSLCILIRTIEMLHDGRKQRRKIIHDDKSGSTILVVAPYKCGEICGRMI